MFHLDQDYDQNNVWIATTSPHLIKQASLQTTGDGWIFQITTHTHTLGLWKHVCRPVWFTLVVDDFGVKYVGKENAKPLMQALQKHY
jgi:hypothetical protein